MTRPPARPRRADALRNYERLLAAATDAFAEHGPQAPLDDIARAAGVGNATLYRHFPTRQALLEAVFHGHIQRLCHRAEELTSAPQPAAALISWLKDIAAQGSAAHGLAASLMAAMEGPEDSWCRKAVSDAAAALLARAQEAGEIRIDVTVRQLLKLVNAIALATEADPKPEEADRLLDILLNGLRTPSSRRART